MKIKINFINNCGFGQGFKEAERVWPQEYFEFINATIAYFSDPEPKAPKVVDIREVYYNQMNRVYFNRINNLNIFGFTYLIRPIERV